MEGGSKAKAASSEDEDVRSAGPPEAPAVAVREKDGAPAVSTPPAPAAAAPPSSRPYYECVFCKRGFTAAQALGGHMNIHRRDRARTPARVVDAHTTTGVITSSFSVSRSTAESNSKYRHSAYSQAPPAMPPMSRAMLYYHDPGTSAAATGGVDEEAAVSPSPIELTLFGADVTRDHDHDHDLHLSLGCHGRGGEGSERQDGEPERKLDLELRLGRFVPGID